jgi:TonB family protein
MTKGIRQPGWSRRWWLAVGSMVLAGQLLAIVWLSDRSPVPLTPVPMQIRVQLAPPGPTPTNLARLFELVDPTVFALPSTAGFAGTAWRTASDPAPEDSDWTEAERLLGGSAQWLSCDWPLESEPGTAMNPGRSALRPATASVSAPVVRMPDRTEVELDGKLARRGLAQPLVAPSMVHSNTLSSSELRVCVEPSGSVFSAVVLKGSGWAAADQQALELAGRARFKPLENSPGSGPDPGAGWEWGQMVFRWHTRPPETPGGGP